MPVVNPNEPPERIPLSKLLILGVMMRLADTFDIPTNRIIPISTSDRMKVAQKAAEQSNNAQIVLPQILLYVTNFIRGDVDNGGYNTRAVARSGVYTKLDDNSGAIQRLHLIQCTMEVEIIYQTNDFFGGLNYAADWLAAGVHQRMNFTLKYMNLPLDIRVEMSEQLAVPEQDASIDVPNYYEYSAGVRVRGWLDSRHQDSEDRVSMLRQVVYAVSAVSDTEVALKQLEDPAEFSTVR